MKPINHSIKKIIHILRLLAVFGLALGFAVTGATAQTYLMPTGPGGGKPDDGKQPFDPNPTDSKSLTRNILTYGADKDGNQIPLKTIRITNNMSIPIFPMMRDPNTGKKTDKFGYISIYNPYDAPDKEYRGYIGYKGEDGQYYFGLKPGQSILVQIPLVFWNGGRISVGTDGKYLTVAEEPNPLSYDVKALRSITAAEKSKDTIPNGVVMWYRADTAIELSDDNANALAEWTIRDHEYLIKVKVNGQINTAIPDNQLVSLINYDVSNVDNLYLPMAMAALDVCVIAGGGPDPQRANYKNGTDPQPYAWTGAINKMDFLQKMLKEFTAPNNKILGQYFGGNGWPFYNFPDPGEIKIPSGANIFPQSPLGGDSWSYTVNDWESNKYLLSSGGTEAKFVAIGLPGVDPNNPNDKEPNPTGSTSIQLSPGGPKDGDRYTFLEKDQVVTDTNPEGNIIQAGTVVTGIDLAAKKVTLSKPTTGPGNSRTLQFNRPVNDYAVNTMTKLWYSWAQYYIKHWKDKAPTAPTAPVSINGSISAQTATLYFDPNNSLPTLVKGMTVSGPGLDKTNGESGPHQGKAIILDISTDKKSVIVSRVANADSKGSYIFGPPQELLWTPKKDGDPGYPLIGDKFQFSNVPEWQTPYEFAQSVYLVMAYMNQIDKVNNSSLLKFMQDNIGGNLGYVMDDAGKASDDGQMVIAMVRDKIKSVLRGVSDFTKYPEKIVKDGKLVQAWYPDPSIPTGGQPYNVFNLDPFVRFVHVNLGFSGYGFSLDDDTADVGADGATKLQLSVGGPTGLPVQSPWSNQVPFGPVTATGTYVITPGDSSPSNFASVDDVTPIRIHTFGHHNLKTDTVVVIQGVQGDTAANGTFKIGNVTPTSFCLFDEKTGEPIKPNGKTPTPPAGQPAGNWSLPKTPYIDTGDDPTVVFLRVKGDDPEGTFQGTVVSVNGRAMDPNHKVRVRGLGARNLGRLILSGKLKYTDGTEVPAGTNTFHYSSD